MEKKITQCFSAWRQSENFVSVFQKFEDRTGLLAQLRRQDSALSEILKWEVLFLTHWVELDESSWAKVKGKEILELRPHAAGKLGTMLDLLYSTFDYFKKRERERERGKKKKQKTNQPRSQKGN